VFFFRCSQLLDDHPQSFWKYVNDSSHSSSEIINHVITIFLIWSFDHRPCDHEFVLFMNQLIVNLFVIHNLIANPLVIKNLIMNHLIMIKWEWTVWSLYNHYFVMNRLIVSHSIIYHVISNLDHESIDHCCHHLIMNHLIMNLCSKPHDQSHVGSSSTAKHWSYHPKNQQPTTYIYILFSSTTNHPLIFSRVTMVRKKVENVIWIETSLSHQKFGFPGCSRNPISGVLYFYTDPAHGSSQSRMDRLSVSIDHRKKKYCHHE
jgi:hypothetical protein